MQLLYVWDLDQSKRPGGEPEAKRARGAYPPQLLFTHAGHRASVSVHMPQLTGDTGKLTHGVRTYCVSSVNMRVFPLMQSCEHTLCRCRRPAGQLAAGKPKPSKNGHPQRTSTDYRLYAQRFRLSMLATSVQVVDFHWNPAEPFTLMSVADDSALDKGGGTLQLWRISDLITRPEEEVLTELEPHRRASLPQGAQQAVASWFLRSIYAVAELGACHMGSSCGDACRLDTLWSDNTTQPAPSAIPCLSCRAFLPYREFIITGTKAGAKPAAADVKEEPAANGTKAAANGKAGAFAVCAATFRLCALFPCLP